MKTRQEVHTECGRLIQQLLDWAELETGTDALNVIGLMLQTSADVLAGACSVEQTIMSMDVIAQHLMAQDAPNANVTFARKH